MTVAGVGRTGGAKGRVRSGKKESVMIVARSSRAIALIAGMFVFGVAAISSAATIDTIGRQAVLVDMTTGTTLFEKNANQHMPTSSMSKIMSMYMVFQAIKEGRISLDDTMPVSQRAWKMQGSKMFTELGNNIRVEDLIRGVIIQSGNDAAIVLAEGLAGSEERFAELMNEQARKLGMSESHFMNSTGWPHDSHYSTARDLALLAQHLITDFPEYYRFYSELEFTYHGIKQGNRNPLLYRNINVDGLKTGHTESAGYGLTASAERNGRRLILVINGLPNMQARADESARLLEWGFREFESYPLFKKGETVETAAVWLGAEDKVPLMVEQDLRVTMNRDERKNLKVSVVMEEPVAAPVRKGTPVGKLVIEAPSFSRREIPLVAAADIDRLGIFGRIAAAAHHLVLGPAN
jgi:D-alanyl-D-alanine carboxypeptidase (penicillin-binding protein 5/6)